MKTEAVHLAELSLKRRISRREWSAAVCKAWDAQVTNLDFLRARLEVSLPMDPPGSDNAAGPGLLHR